jgi:hypothetical protein
MDFILLKGTAHLKLAHPDSDSTRLRADGPDRFDRLSGPAVASNELGTVQLRDEGIDALEKGASQPLVGP